MKEMSLDIGKYIAQDHHKLLEQSPTFLTTEFYLAQFPDHGIVRRDSSNVQWSRWIEKAEILFAETETLQISMAKHKNMVAQQTKRK